MSELITQNHQPMMNSREIAELTEKEHRHVVRDIEKMLTDLGLYCPKMDINDFKGFFINRGVYRGRDVIESIDLDQDLTVTLTMGYKVQLRHKIAKRWRELETRLMQPITTPPVLSKMEILQMAMESEAGRIAEKERADIAERTKSQISRSREASALGKLSAATRQNRQLSERLGESVKHATITAVQNATGIKHSPYPMRKWCKERGIEVEIVPDPRFGSVKSWPAEAWLEIHDVDLKKLFGSK